VTTIAVIEDDPALLDLVQNVFEERDWLTLPLTETGRAVQTLRNAQPDAVLLDLHLGGHQSGWHLLEALQGDSSTSAIPIILWSGDITSMDDKQEWLDERNVQALPKPCDIDDLYACLDDVLESRVARHDAGMTRSA
jgi:DNA-binding response OmpR family regulator